MEIILFAVSGFNILYYAVLVIFADVFWELQLYWPVSALILALIGLFLRIDRKNRQQHKRCVSLEVRTAICTSLGLYFLLIGIFIVLILSSSFSKNQENINYLIVIENGDVEASLTEYDYETLDCTGEYMSRHKDVKVILAGCSRFRDLEGDEAKLQNLMKIYLQKKGVEESRIITEEISNNLRQNIMYSYAYILMDWYQEDADRENDPVVGIVSDTSSIFRYEMIVNSLKRDMKVLSFRESGLLWPSRLVEEMRLILKYHLINQIEYRN
ncbi:MAG: ElyC/SanA/YdcF family protein [Lachnospiraceae bacterium]|nr:ElyC/SanA/YdcF family protein [Lachnospiraceae bacterium]